MTSTTPSDSVAGPTTKRPLEQMAGLVALATPCWAGEAEIVRTYLAQWRTPERDLHWLKAQAYKETFHVRILPPDLQEEAWRTGGVANHPDGPYKAAQVAEEMSHFRLLADLAAELAGGPIAFEDLPALPEDERLQLLREPHRTGNALERAVVDFTEGGGGAMYVVLSRLDGDDFERRVARAFRIIYRDELLHGPAQIHEVARLAQGPDDWRLAAEIVSKVARQRLNMRNEMFSFPLGAARLDQIAAGEIEPWPMPVAL